MDLEFHEATHMPILEPLVEQFDPTSYAHPVPTTLCEHFCVCRETMNGTHNLLFLDCEMVDTAAGKALARLSVLSAARATLLDVYVMPDAAVTDYLTPYSGITAALLAAKADHTLQSARAALLALMHSRTVVAGHALQNDLTVLGLACAHVRILDTCKLYPTETPQTRSHSLKHLVRVYLERDIQGSHGHDSVEDALAVRGLVALKAHRGVDYGVPKAKRRIPLLAKRVGGDRVRAFVPQSIAASMRAWIGPHVAAYDSDRGVMDAVQLHAKLAAAAPSSHESSSGSNSNSASNPGSSRNVVVGIVSSAYFESREVFRTRMDELYSVLPVNGVLAVTVINPVTREEGVFLLGCKV
jgi:DNA polymerase III epsilon subunit-like protein